MKWKVVVAVTAALITLASVVPAFGLLRKSPPQMREHLRHCPCEPGFQYGCQEGAFWPCRDVLREVAV